MVFPQYNYKNISFETVSQSEWNGLINGSYEYCKTITNILEFEGKCKPTELPSFHPYWKNEVKKYDFIRLGEIKRKYDECIKDANKIKYHFNISTTYRDIENKIKMLENSSEGVII